MIDKIEELGVKLVRVDFTSLSDEIGKDLSRSDRKNLPVNLVYPPNYPASPAIMMNELVTPDDAIFAMNYLAENMEQPADSNP